MGLSSSQARLLTLTSRQHSVEHQAQRLMNNKMQLANNSDIAFTKYLNALDSTSLKTLQTDENGKEGWIAGNLYNLMRYETAEYTSGTVFYTQDMNTGKLYIPKNLGDTYDNATDARDFAMKMGVNYTEVDITNRDLNVIADYELAKSKGWDKIMTFEEYKNYLDALKTNLDSNMLEVINNIYTQIPNFNTQGQYQTTDDKLDTQGQNFINALENLITRTGYNYTTTEKEEFNQIFEMLNIQNRGQNFDTYYSETEKHILMTIYDMVKNKTFLNIPPDTNEDGLTEKYYVDADITKDSIKYYESNPYLSLNGALEVVLNGGQINYVIKKQVNNGTITNYSNGTKDVYDTNITNLITQYNNEHNSNYTELGSILKSILSNKKDISQYLKNHNISQLKIENYEKWLEYSKAYHSYPPVTEYVPDNDKNAKYYEEMFKSIEAAGGWIEVSDTLGRNYTWVNNMIKNAQVCLTTWDVNSEMLSKTSQALQVNLKEVTDNTELEKASQEYEDTTALINQKDAAYDKTLSKLESERNALTTEIESLQGIISNNIDKNFKLYS